ncbi:MAG: MBL fold metallo-hydrolase [Cyanobium sp. MAG06]|nr:MBL fold metallo-hydrolase [Cyanobium sp. MAG06]
MLFVVSHRVNKIIFADVGQGDGILIKLYNGENILYDTGKETAGINNIEKFVGILDNIDYLILSHSDTDHSSKAEYFINKYNIKNIFINSKETFKNTLIGGLDNVITTQKGDELLLDRVDKKVNINNNYKNKDIIKMSVINPDPDSKYNDENESSVSAILSYNNFRFIFLADIGKGTELMLLSKGVFDNMGGKINILKVGHHGSDTSSSELLLKKLTPEYCIISSGENNKYGHPNPETIKTLNRHCKNVLRTDVMGNIVFSVYNNDLEINYFK